MDPTQLRDQLIRWADINSGSGNLAGLEAMRAVLAAEFGALAGVDVEHVALPGTTARALRIRRRGNPPRRVLLSGHYDTVYDAHSAFQRCSHIDADVLRGPGVIDMKGGLVVMLAALREFEHSPHADALGWEVLLTPDEETGSAATRALLEETARAGFAFGLIFEPARANGDLVRTRKGSGVFTIICHGRAAHAGRDPQAGRNAILALGDFLRTAHELNGCHDGLTVSPGNFHGGSSAVNVVPDLAVSQIDVRVTRAGHAEWIVAEFSRIAGVINAREGFRVEVSGGFNRPPKEVSPVEEKLFRAWQTCARAIGFEAGWQDVGGYSDGNLLGAAGLPVLDGLGPVGDHVHSPQEFIRLSTLVPRAAATARFLAEFAAGRIAL